MERMYMFSILDRKNGVFDSDDLLTIDQLISAGYDKAVDLRNQYYESYVRIAVNNSLSNATETIEEMSADETCYIHIYIKKNLSKIGHAAMTYTITYPDNTVSEERKIGRVEIFYTATIEEDFSDIKEKGTAYINFKYGDITIKTVAITLK